MLGIAAVQAEHAGAWRATGDLALAARIDGRWQVLIAAPRLRFVDFRIEFDLRNPRHCSIGGTVAFAFTDGAEQEQVIEAQAELSVDAIFFSVRQLSAAPIRLGQIELRIARLLFGFGYTKRSLAVAFAGELELPEAFVDALDSSDAVRVGVRVPQRTSLDFQFGVMPLYVGQGVIPIPMFQFDWDGRQRQSQALRDTRLCEPYWDGLQLIVDGVARIGLKRLSFSPLLAFFACANSDFDGDLALGNADAGLTIVADNLFWPYGLDSGAAVTLAPLHVVPYGDNFCVGVRAAGFRLNFNLQRPVPTFSPLALFEVIALVTDLEHYHVAARGPLADSVRISLTDAWFVLPGPVRRLIPGVDGVQGKVFEMTINLADYIHVLQGAIGVSRQLVKAVLQAGDDAAAVTERLQQAAATLQDGGVTAVTAVMAELLAALPAELRATRLAASFAGFEGHAVLVLTDTAGARAELAARADPASPFHAPAFDGFGADDLDAVAWPGRSGALAADDVTPTLAVSVRDGLGSTGKALRSGLASDLRAELKRWNGTLLPAPLRERMARELNGMLAGAGSGRTLVPRSRARQLPLPETAARLAERSTAHPLAAWELKHLNRAVMDTTLPGPRTTVAVIAGARSRVAGTAGVGFLGGIGGDGRFAFVSAAQLPTTGDGHFRVAGDGALSVRGDLLRVDARFEVADTHAWLEGRLKHTLGTLARFDLGLAGTIGSGDRLVLQGAGEVKLLDMPLAEVEVALGARRLAVAGRLSVDQWAPPGIAAAPVAIDARLAGALDLQTAPPDLRLDGSGRVALFGAELARARVGVECRTTKRPGRTHQPWLAIWFEGTLRWHDRDWLGRRVELDDRTAVLRGRRALHFELKPPGSQTTLMLTLNFDAAVTLGLPAGTLGGLSLRGEWWLGLQRGHDSGALRVPIAVGQVPTLSAGDLPRLLLTVPALLLPRLDGFDEWPLPTLKVTEELEFSVPGSVQLPALEGIWESLTSIAGAVFKGTRYRSFEDDAAPVVDLSGKTPFKLPQKLEISWSSAGLPNLFERFDGFALVLDWDDDSKQLVLRAGQLPPAPRIEVEFDPKGVELGSEFIAFVNDTAEVIRLAGWAVQDGADRARRYVFPDVTLAPGQRTARVWADAGGEGRRTRAVVVSGKQARQLTWPND